MELPRNGLIAVNIRPLKLGNTPHVPSELVSVPETSDQLPGVAIEAREDTLEGKQQPVENCLKSSLRKPTLESGAVKGDQKKKVQWMDFVGKELVEIREFESSLNQRTFTEIEKIANMKPYAHEAKLSV
ncbi:hypothetical protein CJ030_MR1G006864 [Morella rubra]|uniref:Uncharacterized protein n=1 Tax=Morella rubra TaxID=262757 RepID=A0A6A1WWF9_9ROSI|nr:hypothetical protein CJ030_MR1G006864 [Morella rubra]